MSVRGKLLQVVVPLLLLANLGCSPEEANRSTPFVTEYGLGPDKWATAWLLSRRIDPEAKLLVVQPGQALPEGRPFDLPDMPISRQGNRASFEAALDQYHLDDPTVKKLAAIIHDIEVNFWGANRTTEAVVVERGYRELQLRHQRDNVTPECYLTFFDSVYQSLRDKQQTQSSIEFEDFELDCTAARPSSSEATTLIPEVSISHLLSEMHRGKRVEFVDVREPNEFEESHIPGAHNITLRDIEPEVVQRLNGADYVVSYCVKDFRGFEMAKALKKAGVKHSVILNPYGIKGWVSEGLPTSGTRALDSREAQAELSTHIAAADGEVES